MKKLNLYFLLFFVTAVNNNCKKTTVKQPVNTQVEIRVKNTTAFILYNCTVDPFGTLSDNPGISAYNYGQINIDSTSAYKTFSKAYRYCWFRLNMNGKTYYLKPYDYTGESLLQTGRYTYQLTYSAITDRLNLELFKD